MNNFKTKTHKIGNVYENPCFYILSRGTNSGKPLKAPCPNCYVLQFDCPKESEEYFVIASNLFQSNFWHQYLIGSVIPFLTIQDFEREFSRKAKFILADYETHRSRVKLLHVLEKHENLMRHNLTLIENLRMAILHNYCKNEKSLILSD